MYKKQCHKKPKDMKPVDIPLKSKGGATGIEQIPEEVDNLEALRDLRILLNKLTKDNFARISDSITHNFHYTKEILEGLVVISSYLSDRLCSSINVLKSLISLICIWRL